MSVSCSEIKHKSCFQSESTKAHFVKVQIKLVLKSIGKVGEEANVSPTCLDIPIVFCTLGPVL